MNDSQEAKIAWMAWNLLDEIQNLLWNRYDKQFFRFMREEEERNQLMHQALWDPPDA